MSQVEFVFHEPGRLVDAELELVLTDKYPGRPGGVWVPMYRFDMTVHTAGQSARAGRIDLRIGLSRHILMYAGHIGYGVDPPFRGHHLAARSCRLLLPLAWSHGIDPVWITCNPENTASRRTCELAGAEFVEIVPIPEDDELYLSGERFKCRYRIRRPPAG